MPTSGSYFLEEKNVAGLDFDDLSTIRNRKIGFVFQSFKLILADEPTGNLDSKTSEEIMELFVKLKEQGRTIHLVDGRISFLKPIISGNIRAHNLINSEENVSMPNP